MVRRIARLCHWSAYLLALSLASLFLAWVVLARVDFLFPFWYDVLDIGPAVARYAPQNRLRPHFQLTSRAERERLFGAINTAVHDGGRGLAELRYHAPDGRPLGRMLTEPEIIHLQDVARLIGRGRILGWSALMLVLPWSVVLWRRALTPPPLRRLLGAALPTASVAIAAVWLVGPERLFYAWHEWVFPPGHPWFFYYQESLLTTLLKAPDLFGAIALAWVALGGSILGLALVSIRWLTLTKRTVSPARRQCR